MTDPTVLAPFLWTCTVLLLGRVLGQVVVALWAPRWLPPMESWQSGLVPYPVLLASQAVVLALMGWIAADFTRGDGVWTQIRPRFGLVVLVWSYLYAGAMVARYARRMITRPDQRWFGGTIPIVFHTVIAAFQWAFATYHVAVR